MATKNRNAASGRATVQTIEQIEAHAEAIERAECDVMNDLAAWLRAAAVELPPESKLPIRFATTANDVELFSGANGAFPDFSAQKVQEIVAEWGRERCETLCDRLASALGRTVS